MPLPGYAPRVEIKPRGMGTAIAETFGSPGFRLGEPAFDERFAVQSENDAFTRALPGSGLGAWLTPMPSTSPLVVDGYELRTWVDGRLRAEGLPYLLDYLCAASEHVPAPLWPAAHY